MAARNANGTQSARSRRSYGKIGDCEQSILDLSVVLAKSLITFKHLLESHVSDYCTVTWNSGVLFLSTV